MRAQLFAVSLAFVTLIACKTEGAGPAPAPGGGRVAAEGGLCAGIAGIRCGSGLYCQMPEGQCRTPDMAGVCRPQRPFCTKEYNPVCGCDGKTYGNACEAGAAGASILSRGACPA